MAEKVPTFDLAAIDGQTITLGTAIGDVLPVVTTTNAPDGATTTVEVLGLPAGVTYDAATGTISGTPS